MKNNLIVDMSCPPTGIHIECEEIELSVNGVKIKANLPSLEYVEELVINGIKFMRCKE